MRYIVIDNYSHKALPIWKVLLRFSPRGDKRFTQFYGIDETGYFYMLFNGQLHKLDVYTSLKLLKSIDNLPDETTYSVKREYSSLEDLIEEHPQYTFLI